MCVYTESKINTSHLRFVSNVECLFMRMYVTLNLGEVDKAYLL